MGSTSYTKKTTQHAINDRMNEMNDILNNSWDGIGIIDEKGNMIFSNKAFTPILNYSKEELLKVNFLNLVDDTTRDTMKFALIKAKRLKTLTNIDIICNRKDKQKVYLQCSLVLMGNQKYFVLNAKDYTDQVAKNEIINEYVLSYEIDKEGNIIEISDAFSKFMKYSKDELMGKKISLIRQKDGDDAEFSDLMNTVDESFQWEGILKLIDKNAHMYWLETKIKPNFNKYGDTTGYIFISFDVTDKYEALDIYKEANAGMLTAEQEQLQKATELFNKTRFSALSGVIGNITNAWMEPLKDIDNHLNEIRSNDYDQKTLEEKLNSIGNMSTELAKNMTSFKSSFDKTTTKSTVDVKELMDDLIDMLVSSNAKNQVDIQRELQEVPKIETFEDEFRDVTLSIFTNSLEAFKKNQTQKPMIDVTLTYQEAENRMLLQIIDNAGGIPRDILEHIFDPYFSTKEEKGKGMGLYMAKTIIENHLDGKIDIDNDEGMTVVSLYYPTVSE